MVNYETIIQEEFQENALKMSFYVIMYSETGDYMVFKSYMYIGPSKERMYGELNKYIFLECSVMSDYFPNTCRQTNAKEIKVRHFR